MKEYTTEEKIDFIFNELKAQKRNRIFKIIFKLIIIWFIVYWYFIVKDMIENKNFVWEATNMIWEIVTPITESIVDNMVEKTWEKTTEMQEWLLEKIMKK